ncbi:MAG TPA: hypothetical protein VG675_13420 [Bryobacteraceae bacterium]|nr:hypothetical protein [Bryobacteraceae bacterium]
MRLCLFLFTFAFGIAFAAELPKTETLNGKLSIQNGKPATLETADHHVYTLSGDDATTKILGDTRLNGFSVQAKGHVTAPGKFQIDPIHTRALLVHKDGHLKMITYWCDTCSIRAFTPGPCVCCQKETTLDLVDPDQL